MPRKAAPLGFHMLKETRAAATQRSDVARAFHLYMHVHHKRGKGGKGKGSTPPLIPNDAFDIIMALVRDATMASMLEHKQRYMSVHNFCDVNQTPLPSHLWRGSQVVRTGFPSFGPTDSGYIFENMPHSSHFEHGVLSLTLSQQVKPNGPQSSVEWTVGVDMKLVRVRVRVLLFHCPNCSNYLTQIALERDATELEVPPAALTLETDIAKHADHLHLTAAKVEQLLAYTLTAKIVPNESRITFTGANGLGFDVHVKCPFVSGRVLDHHAGFKLGDRVKLYKCYKRYDHFAVGLTGVIRKIQMFSFAIFFLELDDKTHTQSVVDAHRRANNLNLIANQDPEHVACQCFHIYSAAAAARKTRFSPEL